MFTPSSFTLSLRGILAFPTLKEKFVMSSVNTLFKTIDWNFDEFVFIPISVACSIFVLT